MLASSGLCDQLLLAHVFGQQSFSHTVIQLMRSGMVEILPLQIDLCSSKKVGQILAVVERSRAPLEIPADPAQF